MTIPMPRFPYPPDPPPEDEYDSCPQCGAEIYDDGVHVLDPYDRKALGYKPCKDAGDE